MSSFVAISIHPLSTHPLRWLPVVMVTFCLLNTSVHHQLMAWRLQAVTHLYQRRSIPWQCRARCVKQSQVFTYISSSAIEVLMKCLQLSSQVFLIKLLLSGNDDGWGSYLFPNHSHCQWKSGNWWWLKHFSEIWIEPQPTVLHQLHACNSQMGESKKNSRVHEELREITLYEESF